MTTRPNISLTKSLKSRIWFLLRCLFSRKYRKYHAYPLLRKVVRENFQKIVEEWRESEEMLTILRKYSSRQPVTVAEKRFALAQMRDIVRVVPALAIFLLPGGALLLPLLAKALPWSLLPSAFQKKPFRNTDERT